MEQADQIVDLGCASAVTEGVGGPLNDQGIGKMFAGITED